MSNQPTLYNRKLLFIGSIFGLLAVILGAYGAHGLKPILSEAQLETYETGVRFQMYHALFALVVGNMKFLTKKTMNLIYYFVLIGVIFFSGSIYGLATNDLTSFDFTAIALITPIGGMLLILAWLMLLINLYKKPLQKNK